MSDVRYTGYYARQGSGVEPGGPSLSVNELYDALDLVNDVFTEKNVPCDD